jgi:replicative DNA helicase
MSNSIYRPNTEKDALMYGKIPPHDIDIEKAVISAMLNDSNVLWDVLETIPSENVFYKGEHKIFFNCLKEMFNSGHQIDLMTVTDYLRKEGKLDEIGGISNLMDIFSSIISSAHWNKHCAILLEKFIKREEIRIGMDMVKKGYDDTEDATETLSDSINELNNIYNGGDEDLEHIGMSIMDFAENLEMVINNPKHLLGIPSGINGLDSITHGWQNGQLIIIAARPSQGKSALALNLATNAAKADPNTMVAFFSLEMSKAELTRRIVSSESGVELTKMQLGTLNKIEFDTIGRSQMNIASFPLYLDDKAAINYNQVKARLRRRKREFAKKKGINIDDVKMICFIDYLQLMSSTIKGGSREQYVSDISRNLKQLAKDMSIPVIALAQLNRDTAKSGKRPELNDLRESGSLEQDADTVIFVYHNLERKISELLVKKQRNGALGIADVKFITSIQKFIDSYSHEFRDYPDYFMDKQVSEPIDNKPF